MMKLKLMIRWIIGIIIVYTGLLWLIERMRRCRITILCYHRVLDDEQIKDYYRPAVAVSASIFEKQMKMLKRYMVISLEDGLRLLQGEKQLRSHHMVITFDDGYRDNYQHAFPILREHHFPATIFLTADYIGTNKLLWIDEAGMILRMGLKNRATQDKLLSVFKSINEGLRQEIIDRLKKELGLAEAREELMLNWEQIFEMASNGISFGGHTKSHRFLTDLSCKEMKEEIEGAKDTIEQNLNKQVLSFAYPDGRFNKECRDIVQGKGFQCACSMIVGDNIPGCDIFALKRRDISMNSCINPFGRFSRSLFFMEINGMYDIFRQR